MFNRNGKIVNRYFRISFSVDGNKTCDIFKLLVYLNQKRVISTPNQTDFHQNRLHFHLQNLGIGLFNQIIFDRGASSPPWPSLSSFLRHGPPGLRFGKRAVCLHGRNSVVQNHCREDFRGRNQGRRPLHPSCHRLQLTLASSWHWHTSHRNRETWPFSLFRHFCRHTWRKRWGRPPGFNWGWLGLYFWFPRKRLLLLLSPYQGHYLHLSLFRSIWTVSDHVGQVGRRAILFVCRDPWAVSPSPWREGKGV